MYMNNSVAQPYDAQGQPDPNRPGREAMFDFARRRMPAMLPCLCLELRAAPSSSASSKPKGASAFRVV
eukprot:scaffold61701_cov69-Phaeocystis_antarctica.AAC.1